MSEEQALMMEATKRYDNRSALVGHLFDDYNKWHHLKRKPLGQLFNLYDKLPKRAELITEYPESDTLCHPTVETFPYFIS